YLGRGLHAGKFGSTRSFAKLGQAADDVVPQGTAGHSAAEFSADDWYVLVTSPWCRCHLLDGESVVIRFRRFFPWIINVILRRRDHLSPCRASSVRSRHAPLLEIVLLAGVLLQSKFASTRPTKLWKKV